MPDRFSKEKRSQIMSKIRSKGSKIEVRMKEALQESQIEYECHPKMFGKPDFLIAPNIVVFCDSSFWHGRDWRKLKGKLPKEYWYDHIKRNRLRDLLVNDELRNKGYIVLRFWDTQIEKNIDKCVKLVRKALRTQNTLVPSAQHQATDFSRATVKTVAETMWLCPIKEKSWRILQKHGVYGVPCNRKSVFDAVKIGDLLAIYLYPPVRAITGICRVISDPFEDDEPLWGKVSGRAKYRCRIKAEIIAHATPNNKGVPLHKILGFENEKGKYTVEPYLHGILFFKLSNAQSKTLITELAGNVRV